MADLKFYPPAEIVLDAPIRHGDSSFMGEVIDIVVASPEKGPVSLKKQEKMMTLTQRVEIQDVFTGFLGREKTYVIYKHKVWNNSLRR